MIPLIIANIAKAFIAKKVIGYSQTVGEFASSKTNQAGITLMGYGASLLSVDPLNKIGHAYLIGGYLVTVIKDAIVKIKSS